MLYLDEVTNAFGKNWELVISDWYFGEGMENNNTCDRINKTGLQPVSRPVALVQYTTMIMIDDHSLIQIRLSYEIFRNSDRHLNNLSKFSVHIE